MYYVIMYFGIGILLSFFIRLKDNKFAAADMGVLILLLLFWPIIVINLAARVRSLKFRGKILWQKKP